MKTKPTQERRIALERTRKLTRSMFPFCSRFVPGFFIPLQPIDFKGENGGSGRNRTGVHGVAVQRTQSAISYDFQRLTPHFLTLIGPLFGRFATTTTTNKSNTCDFMFPVSSDETGEITPSIRPKISSLGRHDLNLRPQLFRPFSPPEINHLSGQQALPTTSSHPGSPVFGNQVVTGDLV